MAKNAKDYEDRPWGNFTVLSELQDQGSSRDVVIKRLEVHPGKRLSYQRHQLRAEHWFVISGKGIAVIDDEEFAISENNSIDIPINSKHRLDNRAGTEPLIVIETLTGQFDEFDNERLEDDFNRDTSWRNE